MSALRQLVLPGSEAWPPQRAPVPAGMCPFVGSCLCVQQQCSLVDYLKSNPDQGE